MFKRIGLIFVTLSLFSTAAHAAPITFNVAGTFGGESALYGNLSAASYPYPGIFGGTFAGNFVLESSAAAVSGGTSVASFAYTSVDVDIIDSTGTVVHNINSGPNNFRVLASGAIQVNLGNSFGPTAIGVPEDLRLTFSAPGVSPGTALPSVTDILGGSFLGGFSEIDGVTPFTFWDLPVVSATLTADVPAPGMLSLMLLALVGLRVNRRRLQLIQN